MKRITFILLIAIILESNGYGQSIIRNYDSLGRQTYIQYPDSSSISYTYDNSGNIRSKLVHDPCSTKPKPIITHSTPLTFCLGDSVLLTVGPGLSYHWSRGDTTQSIKVFATGRYAVIREDSFTIFGMHDTLDCLLLSDSITVTVNPLPIAGIITGDSTTCPGTVIYTVDTAPGGLWSADITGNATIDSTGMVTGVFAGADTIKYSVTNSCGTAIATKIVTINPVLHAGIITGDSIVCQSSSITLTDSVTGGSWRSSDSTLAVVNSSGIVTGISLGPILITYRVANSCGADSTTYSITINPLPIAGSITGVSSVCVASATTVSDTVTGGTWSSSNISVASIDSIGNVTGVVAGIVSISYAVTNSCGVAYAVLPLTVNPLPIASGITGVATVCIGNSITLSDTTSGGTWASSGSSVASVTTVSGIVSGISVGSAIISYTVSNVCGTSSTTVSVPVGTIPPAPSAISSPPSIICVGSSTTISTSTSGGTWSSASPSVATIDSTGIVSAISPGTTVITYTVSNACGSNIVTLVLTISPLPYAGIISGSTTVCAGNHTTLIDSTSGGSWSSSNTAIISIGSTGIATGVSAGVATISYSKTNSCGTVSATAITTVNAIPSVPSITGSPAICNGATGTLSNSMSGGIWTSGTVTRATITSGGVVTGISVGTTVISYSVTNSCGTGRATIPMTVNTTPNPITGTPSVCTGKTITLSTTSTGGTWSCSDTTLAAISTLGIVAGINAGNPTISYSLSNGCYKTAITTVNQTPATIVGSATLCTSNVTILTDSLISGTWSSGSGTLATVSGTGVVTGIASGSVTITYTKAGCFVTKSMTISINTVSVITGASVSCIGRSTTLSNSSPGGTWVSSNTSIAAIDSTMGIVTGISVGSDIISYSIGGCYKTTNITVNVTPANIIGSGTICTSNIATISDSTPGGTWSSSFPSIAWVAGTGELIGWATGTTTISYTKNGCSATLPVTVNTNSLAAIAALSVVCVGGTVTASDATTGGAWSSDNTSLATVNASTGVITGVSAGLPVITYSFAGCYKTATFTVNSNNIGNITGSDSVCIGSSITLSDTTSLGAWSISSFSFALVSTSGVVAGFTAGTSTISYSKYSCSATIPITVFANPLTAISGSMIVCVANTITLADAMTGGTWSSGTPSLATVGNSTGIVTGVATGSPRITYTLGSGCYISSTITIGAPLTTAITGPSAVSVGNVASLTDATSGGAWASSSPSNLTIAWTGVMTGVAVGTATISYTKTGCSITKPITVNPNTIAPIGGPNWVCLGGTTTATDATTGGTWSCSNPAVATIDATSGVITTVSAGLYILTYTAGGSYVTHYCGVGIPLPPISGSGTVCTSTPDTLTDSISSGSWYSSNTGRATVALSTGIVTGHTNGTATISYYKTGCYAFKPITVNICRIGNEENPEESSIGDDVNIYSLYPNPSTGLVNIVQSIPENMTTNVRVMNYIGQTIYSGLLEFSNGLGQLNLSNVIPGIYMIELREDRGRIEIFSVVLEPN